MSEEVQNMDLGEFGSKVDQMAAMINQLQEAGRQNEAVDKLKQLMSTLVKVCPETAAQQQQQQVLDETGDHNDDHPGTFDPHGTSESVVQSILTELISKAIDRSPKTKKSGKVKGNVIPVEALSKKSSTIIKRKRGRPPKNSIKTDANNEVASGLDGFLQRGSKRKNPNPKKLTVDEDEDDFTEAPEQSDVDYVCKTCTSFTTKAVSKYIRHMRLHNDALLSCWNCRKDQYSLEEFHRHQCSKLPAKGKKKQPTLCNICSAMFFSKKKYKEHMKNEHDIAIPEDGEIRPQFRCEYCDKPFLRKILMFQHYKEHAGEQWVCQTCGSFCADFDAYTNHMDEHSKQAKFNCDKCGLSFQKKQQFEQHMTAHTKYDCTKCGYRFSTKKDMHRHERKDHGTKVPWKHKYHSCDQCGKSFPRPGMLAVHQRIHTGEKPLECTTCKMFFRTPKALGKHKRTLTHMQRTGNFPVERRNLCSLCGKAYFRRQGLLRHQKYHTGERPYQCPHCPYTCPEGNNLKRHILLHFSSQRTFMCEICGSSFHAKKTLEMHHIYKHSEDRQYKCSECSMSFKAANALRRHARSHSSAKPYVCWCGASFNRQYNLRRHMKSVHGTDDSLPPVRKVAVLDTPQEELDAKAIAEAEKEANKTKSKRGRKTKQTLASLAALSAPTSLATPVQPVQTASIGQVQIQTVTVDPHQQHLVIASPSGQHQMSNELSEQELQQHVMATLPRVIDDQALINSQLSSDDIQIHHVQLAEVHVHPEMESSSQTGAPTHVIVSAPENHSSTSSISSRPMSVPHQYTIPVGQQQWHLPIVMPTQVDSHILLDEQQHQQISHHMNRSDTPTSQANPIPVSVPIMSRHVWQTLGSSLHERPMSHPSAQSVVHHPQMQVSSGHLRHSNSSVLQSNIEHLQTGQHMTYPEVTYTSSSDSKHMVLIPSIAPGTEVVSPQEEQFLAKAEQAAMENMTQYQPASTGYTGLPILLHQINTSN